MINDNPADWTRAELLVELTEREEVLAKILAEVEDKKRHYEERLALAKERVAYVQTALDTCLRDNYRQVPELQGTWYKSNRPDGELVKLLRKVKAKRRLPSTVSFYPPSKPYPGMTTEKYIELCGLRVSDYTMIKTTHGNWC